MWPGISLTGKENNKLTKMTVKFAMNIHRNKFFLKFNKEYKIYFFPSLMNKLIFL